MSDFAKIEAALAAAGPEGSALLSSCREELLALFTKSSAAEEGGAAKRKHIEVAVTELTSMEHYQALLKEHGKLIVDFNAPWCQPCKKIAPLFHDLAEKNPGVKFVSCDYDEHDETIGEACGVPDSLPSFAFVSAGGEVDLLVGAKAELLSEKVAAFCAPEEAVTELASMEHYQALLKEHGKLIVDFNAPWCQPCKKIAPLFHDLAEKNPGVKFVSCDYDEHDETIGEACGVPDSLPSFAFVSAGGEVDLLVGAKAELLSEKVAAFCAGGDAAPSASGATAAKAAPQTEFPALQSSYDCVVIGGGSGGAAASKESAMWGASTLVFDYVDPSPSVHKTTWGFGGTCVNVGCVPKKLMHYAANIGHLIHHDAAAFGWQLPAVTHSWVDLVENVQAHIGKLNFFYKKGMAGVESHLPHSLQGSAANASSPTGSSTVNIVVSAMFGRADSTTIAVDGVNLASTIKELKLVLAAAEDVDVRQIVLALPIAGAEAATVLEEMYEDFDFSCTDATKECTLADYLGTSDRGSGPAAHIALTLKNPVKYVNAKARFKSKTEVEWTAKDGTVKSVTFGKCIVAVGGRPYLPPPTGGRAIPGFNEVAITSDDLFKRKVDPGRVLVVGGGYIALECGGFLSALGYDVTIVVRDVALRGMDRQSADKVVTMMQKLGVNVLFGVSPTKCEAASASASLPTNVTFKRTASKAAHDPSLAHQESAALAHNAEVGEVAGGHFHSVAAAVAVPAATIGVGAASVGTVSPVGLSGAGEEEEFTMQFDTVLAAMGRYAITGALNLDAAGLGPSVDERSGQFLGEETNDPNIFAIGDCVWKVKGSVVPELTPVAIKSGELLARRLFKPNFTTEMDYDMVPTVVFSPVECVEARSARARSRCRQQRTVRRRRSRNARSSSLPSH